MRDAERAQGPKGSDFYVRSMTYVIGCAEEQLPPFPGPLPKAKRLTTALEESIKSIAKINIEDV